MPLLHRMRARLALRSRFRDPVALKHDAQLRWWLQQWDPVIRAGGLKPEDALDFLPGEPVDTTYSGRRWQLVRSQGCRSWKVRRRGYCIPKHHQARPGLLDDSRAQSGHRACHRVAYLSAFVLTEMW
jgi:hypothetical protein